MTVAQIAGFVTRQDAGLAPPRSISRSIAPQLGGLTVHYGGPAPTIRDHADCVATWRAWQTFHMGRGPAYGEVDGRGWVDIAYTGGVCDHGYAFAGRGAGIRTAANGTSAGNGRWYAVVWIGGGDDVPTQQAIDAMAWWRQQLRDHGDAAAGLVDHSHHKPTACAGDAWRRRLAWVADARPATDPPPRRYTMLFYAEADDHEAVSDHLREHDVPAVATANLAQARAALAAGEEVTIVGGPAARAWRPAFAFDSEGQLIPGLLREREQPRLLRTAVGRTFEDTMGHFVRVVDVLEVA